MSKYKAGDVVYVRGLGDHRIIAIDTRDCVKDEEDIRYETKCLYDPGFGSEYIHEIRIIGLWKDGHHVA